MSLDLSTFNPQNAKELAEAITGEISTMGKKWWDTNKADVEGYVRSLAEASVQTGSALAEGRIKQDQARMIFQMQKTAYQNTLHYTKYMTLVLGQKVLDKTFEIISAVIRNKTGLNLFPS